MNIDELQQVVRQCLEEEQIVPPVLGTWLRKAAEEFQYETQTKAQAKARGFKPLTYPYPVRDYWMLETALAALKISDRKSKVKRKTQFVKIRNGIELWVKNS